jgi:hypothetical protein
MKNKLKYFFEKGVNIICVLSLLLGIIHIGAMDVYGDGTIEVGSYITYGRYNGQPVIWQVINIDETGNPLLFSKEILSFKAYDAAEIDDADESNEFRTEYGNNRWAASNIKEWLNSDDILVDYSTAVPSSEAVSNGNNPYDYEKGFLVGFTDIEILGILNRDIHTVLSLEDLRYKDGGSEKHEFEYGIPFDVVNNYDTSYY